MFNPIVDKIQEAKHFSLNDSTPDIFVKISTPIMSTVWI